MNQENLNHTWKINVFIGAMAALFFIPFLGSVHLFDWDEINFAESAREMLASGDYLNVQINFVPFWEKPPLFIWMQALSMHVFGVNEFAARFPNALCGIISLIVLFHIGKKIQDARFGLIWTLLYAGSILPFFYFKSGIIDPWFNLFIFLGIYQLYQYFEHTERKGLHAMASGLFIGLAVLTKGPVALLVTGLSTLIFLIIKRFHVRIRATDLLLFICILFVTGGFWFILQIIEGNFNIIADFITYQIRLFKTKDAGHGGFLLYHFVILFIGVFPASIFALPSILPSKKPVFMKGSFYSWMIILFWVVLILFTIVKTKIVHYSSLCYFPLTFAGAYTLYHERQISQKWKKSMQAIVSIIGLVIAIVLTGITFIDHFKNKMIEWDWIKDPFTRANLNADGEWKGYEMLAALVLVGGVIYFNRWSNRKGLAEGVKRSIWVVPIFMFLSMLLIVPRIEAYSQRAAISFFQSVSHEDAYMQTIGYKSYAHLFYGRIREHNQPLAYDKEWLIHGNIDKNVYFSVKIHRKEKFMNENPELIFLYEENGFAFFKREHQKIYNKND